MLNTVDSPSVRIAATLLFCALSACGGGGDGGSGGSGGSADNGQQTGSGPVAYTGNTGPAVITTRNAARLAAGVLGTDMTVAVTAAASPGGPTALR